MLQQTEHTMTERFLPRSLFGPEFCLLILMWLQITERCPGPLSSRRTPFKASRFFLNKEKGSPFSLSLESQPMHFVWNHMGQYHPHWGSIVFLQLNLPGDNRISTDQRRISKMTLNSVRLILSQLVLIFNKKNHLIHCKC